MASATKGENLPARIREVARAEISAASAELGQRSPDHKNIHQARRHLKKLRALLRLLRDRLPAALFQSENRSFQALGRQLAPIRDASVLVKTATSLKKASTRQMPSLARTIAVLRTKEPALDSARSRAKRCLPPLNLARQRVETWPIETLTREDLREGVQETFRRGRKAFRNASKNPEDKMLHNLRKRVKDLEYHLNILKPRRTSHAKKTRQRVAKLDDYLGDDHDLAVLTQHLQQRNFPVPKAEIEVVLRNICNRRSRLQKCALKLAGKLFAKKPRRFARMTIQQKAKVKKT